MIIYFDDNYPAFYSTDLRLLEAETSEAPNATLAGYCTR